MEKQIELAFNKMKESYQKLFRGLIIPSRDRIGFTERNLTYHLCNNYEKINQSAFIWNELPILKAREHIDSAIVDICDSDVNIYYIEAKRVYEVNQYVFGRSGEKGSLLKDCLRLSKCCPYNIPSFKDLADKGYRIHEHIVLLAGMEQWDNNRQNTYKEKHQAINDFFNETKEFNANLSDLFEIRLVKVNDDESNPLCEIKSTKGLDSHFLTNYFIYMMIMPKEIHIPARYKCRARKPDE